jgi:hypothetical protein
MERRDGASPRCAVGGSKLVAAGLRSGVGSQIAGIEVETEIDCAGPI